MLSWSGYINDQFQQLYITRKRYPRQSTARRYLNTKNKQILNFVSNDYLGLSNDLWLQEAMQRASLLYGVGSTGAATLSGYTEEQNLLSQEIANWLGFEKSLIFGSGYLANVGIFAPLVNSDTFIWIDKNCHASHIDGIRLSRGKFSTFSAENFAHMVTAIKEKRKRYIIVTEGTFSMDGTSQYLPELLRLKATCPEEILLIVDDAHGVGALGKRGYGTLEQLGLDHNKIDLLVGTFGKAFGSYGGFVCGNEKLINYLQQTVRSQIFSTCLPPAVIAANRASLQIIASDEGYLLRKELKEKVQFFKGLVSQLKLPTLNEVTNFSQIQLISLASEEQTSNISGLLLDEGIMVGKMICPTVPKDKPRLRISLNVNLTLSDIGLLCYSLHKYIYA